jgi:TRAP-type C4-dicarboxylate transport system substrate-binding protein
MKLNKIFTILVVGYLLVSLVPARTIKLGSLAPAGTPWDKSLKKMSAEWSKISRKKIKLKIYPGGIVGDEPDMLRKMRLGQLHAAGVTAVSLFSLDPGLTIMHLPLLIQTNGELEYVLGKMKPQFEKRLEKKGFKVLFWSIVGWAHFYSKQPVVTPDDLRKQKLFVWEGNPDEIQSYKEIGFNPVPLAATDIMSSLQSGMIQALATTPLNAASNQWFGVATHMCGMKWAPLLGAVIINTKVWKKIPSELQPRLWYTAQQIGMEMQQEVFKTEKDAVNIMVKNGLTINAVPPETVEQWEQMVSSGFQKFVGKGFNDQELATIRSHLEEFRKKNGAD